MADGEENIELKFRIFDGTDIGHRTYGSSTTVAALKQRLVAEWPQGKSVVPKSVNDMKLIHAGRVLENSKTLSESRIHVGGLAGGVITMHVVVQPVVAKKKSVQTEDPMERFLGPASASQAPQRRPEVFDPWTESQSRRANPSLLAPDPIIDHMSGPGSASQAPQRRLEVFDLRTESHRRRANQGPDPIIDHMAGPASASQRRLEDCGCLVVGRDALCTFSSSVSVVVPCL